MRRRLSLLMFLQYAVPGAWLPVFPLVLKGLQFTPVEIGWACATSALGAILAPLLWGQIADRWIAAQYCISVCAFAGGVLLWVMSNLTSPLLVFVVALAHWCFIVPIFSMGTALTFRHLRHPEDEFGRVRLWGTMGWVLANWALSIWYADPEWLRPLAGLFRAEQPGSVLADALRLGGLLAFGLSFYALTLPHTPPSPPRSESPGIPASGWFRTVFDAPLLALQLFRQRSFFIFCICLMGLYITMPFNGQMTPLLLESLLEGQGVSTAWLPTLLTLGQSLEIVALGILPFLLLRLGVKGTLLVGILAWTGALAVLAIGEPFGLVVASLGLHGIYITCYLVAGQVFVNRHAQKDIRASAQALLQFLNGVGLLTGHLLVGWVRAAEASRFSPVFAGAAILSGTLVVVFMLGFRDKAAEAGPLPESLVPGPENP